MKKLKSYYNWDNATIPLSSAIRVRAISAKESIGWRDWYVFGIRVMRFQLMAR
jgi:hypothetical protein